MATKMPTVSVPSTFPRISKVHVKETFALYNHFVKNVMKYQSAIKDLALSLSEFSHSYDSFLSYEPMRAIIESNNKQYDIFDSLEIHRVLYECLIKLSEYLEKNFGHLSNEFEKNQNKYYEKDIEKSLKAEEKLRSKGYLPAEPSTVQKKLYKQYISSIQFVTHKTKKFQNCEIQLLKNTVQNMISINNRNIEKNILHNLDKSLDKSLNQSLNRNSNRESTNSQNLNNDFFLDFPELEKILKSIPHDNVPSNQSFIKDDKMDSDDYHHRSLGYPQKNNTLKFNSSNIPSSSSSSSSKNPTHHLKDRPRSSSLKNLTPNHSDPGKHVTFVDRKAVYGKLNGINDPASSTDSLQSYCSARSCNSTLSYIRHRTGDMNTLSNKPHTSTIPNGYATPLLAHRNPVFHPSESNGIIPIDYATPILPERPAVKNIQNLDIPTESSDAASNDEVPLSPPATTTKSELPTTTTTTTTTKSQLPTTTTTTTKSSPTITKSQLPTTSTTTIKSSPTITKSQLPTTTTTKSSPTVTKSQLPTTTTTKSKSSATTSTKSSPNVTKSQLPTTTTKFSPILTKSQLPTTTTTKSKSSTTTTTTKSKSSTTTKSKSPTITKSQLPTTSTKSKSSTTKSQLPTTSTKSKSSTTTKSQLPTTTTKSKLSTTTKSQSSTSTKSKSSTTTKSSTSTKTKSLTPTKSKSLIKSKSPTPKSKYTSLPVLNTLRKRPVRNESLKFCPSLNKQEVKDSELKFTLKIDSKHPKNSTCSTESIISAIESEIIDSIKESNEPIKNTSKNTEKNITSNVSPNFSIKTKINFSNNVSPSFSIKTKISSSNTEEDTAFNTNSETSTIVEIKNNGTENDLDNESVMSETTMKEVVPKENREEHQKEETLTTKNTLQANKIPPPPLSPRTDSISAIPKIELNNIEANCQHPSELNSNNQNDNDDVIIFSNPLMEITNNKNLAVYKRSLSDERLELHILKNNAYIALNLCPQSVEAESVIGSIVDNESAVGSCVDLDEDINPVASVLI